MAFTAGYKFKESHPQIHYVKVGHGQVGDEYGKNFSQDGEEAKPFATSNQAESCILNLMQNFQRDDDYRWTPVIIDLDDNSHKLIISSEWH